MKSYENALGALNQPATGALPPKLFATFFNEAQVKYMEKLLPLKIDGKSNDSLAPFFKDVPVPIDQFGNGTWNTGDSAYEPIFLATGYVSPDCGQPAEGDPTLIQVNVIRDSQWASMTSDLVNKPALDNPFARISGANTAEFRPRNLGFVTARYVRLPREIVVGSWIDNNGEERPLEGAPNQVDPEWGDDDVMAIIDMVLARTGLRLQSSRLQMAGREQA